MRRFWLLALLVFAFDGYLLQHDETSNARTRLALTRAIVLEGRLTIDSFHEGIFDKALYQGHYYCDKAPFTSVAAVPILAGLRAAGITEDPAVAYLTRLLTVSLATALSLPLFGRLLLSLGFAPQVALATCAAGWLGTALLPYGTVFFGHNLTFALVVAALAVRSPAARGALLGLAITSDYQAVLLAAVLGGAMLVERRLRDALLLLAGATPPLLALLAYHHALFGDPFTLPVKYEIPFEAHAMVSEYDEGFYGMGPPSPRALWLLLLSPAKGLLTLSPFLLTLGWAFRRPVREELRIPWRTSWAAVAVYLPFIASIPSYHGGFSFGPRLLIPLLPFVLVLLALGLECLPPRLRIAFWAAVAGSALAYAAASTTLIAVPYSYRRPLVDITVPWLLAGHTAWNAGMLLGLEGATALLPLCGLAAILLFAALRPERKAATSGAPP